MSFIRHGLCTAAFVFVSAAASSEPATPPFPVEGLEKPASVLIDRWGVPHIYANTLYDVFFVQGFTVARDRLWQIDLWRKRGLGEMAKDFGPAYAEGDAMARTVLFRGDMYREWLAYGSDAKRVAEAFAAGVNAYVDLVAQKPELLPIEFQILNYKPARWQAEDIVRIRHHGLTLNFSGEIDRAVLYCKAGKDGARADWLRRELVPPVTPQMPEGLNPCEIPAEPLKRAYKLATAAPQFSKAMKILLDKETPSADALYVADSDGDANRNTGSNNWVISGKKTETGRPILANDPHRAHGAPSLRYISHLNAPGLNVIGAGEPFLPGISIGHNGTIGFGLTRFYMDQEDVYIYETHPERPEEYRYQGRWEPMKIITETIEIKGEAPREIRMAFTRHGPVLHTDTVAHRAWALRAAWLDAGMAPYFGSMDYMRSKNWDQFRAAMNRWGAPGENQVYADTMGNIGLVVGGLTVIRPNWDGLMPVPGDGRYEWAGYRHMDELPFAYNPEAGYIVTANENNIPLEHPAMKKGIGYEWSNSTRAVHLKKVFASKAKFTFAESLAQQNDTVSGQAQRVVKLLQGLSSPNPRTQQALEILQKWDGDMRADSNAAVIYEVWFYQHLSKAAIQEALPTTAAALVGSGDDSRVVEMLEKPQRWMTPQQRDALFLVSLEAAIDTLSKQLGPDMKRWQWGQLHVAEFRHRLADVVDEATREKLNVGRWPVGGSDTTPMMTWYRTKDFHLEGGASFRMVLDVGNWDASRVVNAPGQSGDPDNPHYRDLAPLWLKGQYFPLLYSREMVEKEVERRIELIPK